MLFMVVMISCDYKLFHKMSDLCVCFGDSPCSFTLHYISRQAEAHRVQEPFCYADGLLGGPAKDHEATPRAHPYGMRVGFLVGSLRSGRVT